jgi:hypothetical protein
MFLLDGPGRREAALGHGILGNADGPAGVSKGGSAWQGRHCPCAGRCGDYRPFVSIFLTGRPGRRKAARHEELAGRNVVVVIGHDARLSGALRQVAVGC